MADIERDLLWKALSTGEFMEVPARGIEEEHFADPECREVYAFAMDFAGTYDGSPPSTTVIKKEFPDFRGSISKDPLGYHMEDFVLKVKERKAIELARDYHDAIDDPEQLVDIEVAALEMARQLTEVIPSPRAAMFSDKGRYETYVKRLKEEKTVGIQIGVPAFDQETMGIQPHEFVVIAAYLGMGKSTFMQFIAYSAYLQRKKTLYLSLEMEAEAILRKLDTMALNFKYHALKALELGVGDRERWLRMLDKAHEERHERDIIIRDDIANCTADKVMAETLRWKPDLVMIDYLELMSTPRGVATQHWEAISYTGISLKQNARVLKIPILTAAQLNRDGGKGDVNLANVGHQSIGKHSDLIIGLARDEEKEERQEMDGILLKNRDGKKARWTMRWNLETMDLGEKGVEERFPNRKKQPLSKTKQAEAARKNRRLAAARTAHASEQPNPWKKRVRGAEAEEAPARPRRRRRKKTVA